MGNCFIFHCWHEIPNTRRTILTISNCKKINETIVQNGEFAYYKKDEECCRCNKKRTRVVDDYDISRASQYPTEKEYNNGRKRKN